MKKRKITSALLNQLDELKNTRESIDLYCLNFLLNAAKYSNFMHYVLASNPDDETIQIPKIQYISSLVSCWETFFRDIFIYMLQVDTLFKQHICDKLDVDASVQEKIIDDSTFCEFLSKSFNFQNIDDIENAFEYIFNKQMYAKIASYQVPYLFIKGRLCKDFSLGKSFTNWEDAITQAFSERHRIIHDANYIKSISVDRSFIQLAEAIFIIFPQILSFWLAAEYNLYHNTILMDIEQHTISKSNDILHSYPCLLTVQDLISQDWVICD